MKVTKEVREYMAAIGRKGGAKGKGTDWRREVCRNAINARWRAYRARKQAELEKAKAESETILPVPVLAEPPVVPKAMDTSEARESNNESAGPTQGKPNALASDSRGGQTDLSGTDVAGVSDSPATTVHDKPDIAESEPPCPPVPLHHLA